MERDLKVRTKRFALQVVDLIKLLPKTVEANVFGKQLLRSATSSAANYRAAGRARSKKEFAAKISIVLEEVDESLFWLEMLHESGVVEYESVASHLKEAEELVKIFSTTRKKLKE